MSNFLRTFHRWRRQHPEKADTFVAWVERTSGHRAVDILSVTLTGGKLHVEVIERPTRVDGDGVLVTRTTVHQAANVPADWPH